MIVALTYEKQLKLKSMYFGLLIVYVDSRRYRALEA